MGLWTHNTVITGSAAVQKFLSPSQIPFPKRLPKYWSIGLLVYLKVRNICTDTCFFAVRSREKAIFKIKRKLAFDNRRCESHCVRSVFVDKRKEERKSNI